MPLLYNVFFYIFKWKISFVYVWYKHNFLYFLIQITFVRKIDKGMYDTPYILRDARYILREIPYIIVTIFYLKSLK